ncbi:MAG TPA: hypothetical protein VFV09_01160 [Actinomycetota bacterium]|nr:hypothetical protein [Actinomycetota bacterium]
MDAHRAGGLWLLREMWDFPDGVPEDDRVDYLKTIMVTARADGELGQAEKEWVIGYGAACGAPQATVDALEAYDAGENVADILARNMPVANTWGRVAVFDAIRASHADHDYDDEERASVRRIASALGVSDDVVAEIEQLCDDERALKKRRIDLVFGGQTPY